MDRVEALLTLEAAGELPPDLSTHVETLRRAGEFPPPLTSSSTTTTATSRDVPFIGLLAPTPLSSETPLGLLATAGARVLRDIRTTGRGVRALGQAVAGGGPQIVPKVLEGVQALTPLKYLSPALIGAGVAGESLFNAPRAGDIAEIVAPFAGQGANFIGRAGEAIRSRTPSAVEAARATQRAARQSAGTAVSDMAAALTPRRLATLAAVEGPRVPGRAPRGVFVARPTVEEAASYVQGRLNPLRPVTSAVRVAREPDLASTLFRLAGRSQADRQAIERALAAGGPLPQHVRIGLTHRIASGLAGAALGSPGGPLGAAAGVAGGILGEAALRRIVDASLNSTLGRTTLHAFLTMQPSSSTYAATAARLVSLASPITSTTPYP